MASNNLGALEIGIDIDMSGLRNDFKEVGSKMDGFKEKMGGIGDAMAPISSGFAVLGGAAIASAAEFGSANSMMQAQLGLTAEEAEATGEVVKGVMEKGVVKSADEASQAVIAVKNSFKDLKGKELEDLSAKAANVSKIMEEDVNVVMDRTSSFAKQMGIDADKAFDIMVKGQQEGLNKNGELMDTLAEYAPHFKQMGYSAEESLSMLVNGSKDGVFTIDKLGDAVKEASLRLGDMGKAQEDAVAELGFDPDVIMEGINAGGDKAKETFAKVREAINGVGSEADKQAYRVALFGTPFEDIGAQAFENMQPAKDAMKDIAGTSDEAGKALEESFGARMTGFMAEMKSSLEPLGLVLMDLAEEYGPPLVEMITDLAKWFKDLSPQVQKIIGIFTVVMSVLAPLIGFIATLVGWVQTLWPIIAAVGQAFAWVGGIIGGVATGPLIAIIAAIAAVIAIVVVMVKKWDQIGPWLANLFTKIGEIFMQALDFIVGIVKNLVMFVIDYYKFLFKTAFAIFSKLGQFLFNTFIKIKDFIVNKVKQLVDLVVGNFNEFVSFFGGLPSRVLMIAQNVVSSIFDTISGLDLFGVGQDIVSGLINGIKNMFGALKRKVGEIAGGIKDTFKNVLGIHSPSKVMEEQAGYVGDGVEKGLDGSVKGVIDSTKKLGKSVKDTFKNTTLDSNLSYADQIPPSQLEQKYNSSSTPPNKEVRIDNIHIHNKEDIRETERMLNRLIDQDDRDRGE